MEVDWRGIFVPQSAPVEIVLRGTVMYLLLFLALRFFLKRNTGQIGVPDLLVIVLISEVSQNALIGESSSAADAGLAVAVVLFWSYALNWLSFRVPVLERLTGGRPLTLIEDGRLNRANMARELITYDELMAQLRMRGLDDVRDVKRACLEGDGSFSVIRRDGGGTDAPPQPSAG